MYEVKATLDGKLRGKHNDLDDARRAAHRLIKSGINNAWVIGDDGVRELHSWSYTNCDVCHPATCCICGELSGGGIACMGCWDEAVHQGLIPGYGE